MQRDCYRNSFQNIFGSRPHSKTDARAIFILVEASSLCCLIQFDQLVLRHAIEGLSRREGSESIPSLSPHQNIRVFIKLHVDIYLGSKFTKNLTKQTPYRGNRTPWNLINTQHSFPMVNIYSSWK
jgi:hypothetical protein